jgi:hypothetical protein
MNTTDWEGLIPELRAWREHNKNDIRPEGWIECVGNYELTVGYSALFWPRFVEIDGMVFHERVSSEAVREWLASTKGDKQATEVTLNHIHILHLHHPGLWSKATREQIIHLGRTLRDIYELKLRRDFPTKNFIVDFDESPQVSIEDYQLVWYQRNEKGLGSK